LNERKKLEYNFEDSFLFRSAGLLFLVQQGNCKTLVRLDSQFVNDWTSYLFVLLTVMLDLQKQEVVLVHQVVLVVPPFRVVLIEFEVLLGDDRADEGDFARPSSF